MKEKKDLIIIHFEGEDVKPLHGSYRCPFDCGTPGFPKAKWKTEKGFRSHMEKCVKKPSFLERKKEREDKNKEIISAIKTEIINSLSPEFPIGRKIFYIKETILKPTHEWKWTRLVRVRYEAVKKFEASDDIIRSIDFNSTGFSLENVGKEFIISNCVRINKEIRISDIFSTLEETQEEAKRKQMEYDEHIKLSESVR